MSLVFVVMLLRYFLCLCFESMRDCQQSVRQTSNILVLFLYIDHILDHFARATIKIGVYVFFFKKNLHCVFFSVHNIQKMSLRRVINILTYKRRYMYAQKTLK